VYVVGYWWAFGLLLLRLAIGPALSVGYSTYEMWGHTIQFISGMIYMNLFILLHRFVFKKFDEKFNLLLSGVVTIIVASLLMAFLNALVLTPMYWMLYGYIDTPTPSASKASYSYVKDVAFLGIPNYWAGMMTAFGLGNLAKYTVVTITFIALWKVVKRYEIPSKKQNKKEVKNVK
ncbi:MAG: hypothetical protein KAG04_01160, partial [Mycoplasmataceae bacterium]|nr:hypothetical protein [Mycoplasmataceae bacterium]